MTTLLPDPASLADQLEHARGARDHLDRVIAWLEDGIELIGTPRRERAHDPLPPAAAEDAAVPARELPEISAGSGSSTSREVAKPEPPAPPAEPAPAAAAAPPRVGARDVEAKILHALLTANQPLSRQHISERTGLELGQIKNPLQRLVADGRIIATGATVSRRYRRGEHKPHSEAGARTTAGRARNEQKITDAVSRVGLRDRVMKAISADPAALDNQRLALALDADLEDIADACSYLVTQDRVQMAEDGTYLRSVAESVREIAAA